MQREYMKASREWKPLVVGRMCVSRGEVAVKEHVLIIRFCMYDFSCEVSPMQRPLTLVRLHTATELDEDLDSDVLRTLAVALLTDDHLLDKAVFAALFS